jgi:hypothetical protein
MWCLGKGVVLIKDIMGVQRVSFIIDENETINNIAVSLGFLPYGLRSSFRVSPWFLAFRFFQELRAHSLELLWKHDLLELHL